MKESEDKIPAVGRPRLMRLYDATSRPDQAAQWEQKLAEFEKAETEKKPAAEPPPK